MHIDVFFLDLSVISRPFISYKVS